MKTTLAKIIDESIRLEMNVASLYEIYSSLYPEDSGLWDQLSREEVKHATIIKAGKDVLLSSGEFPGEILSPSLQVLHDLNVELGYLLKKFKTDVPTRKYALDIALNIENASGEVHFQRTMEYPSNSAYVSLFQKLCDDDKDHAKRIIDYMKLNIAEQA